MIGIGGRMDKEFVRSGFGVRRKIVRNGEGLDELDWGEGEG